MSDQYVSREDFNALAEQLAASAVNSSRLEARVAELAAQVTKLSMLVLTRLPSPSPPVKVTALPPAVPTPAVAHSAHSAQMKEAKTSAAAAASSHGTTSSTASFTAKAASFDTPICTLRHRMEPSAAMPGPYADYGWSCKMCGDSSGVQRCERWFCDICSVSTSSFYIDSCY